MKTHFIKKTWLYLVALVAFSSLLCFFTLGGKSFSLDEVSTINFTRNFEYLKQSMWLNEGNMWLYYFFMHFWLKLGDSEFVVRSLSAIFGVFSAVSFYFLAKEMINEKMARVALPLFLTNLYFIYYAQTARSYSLALLLSIMSSYFFVKFVKNTNSTKYLIFYCVISVLMIYAYLLTALLIAAQFLSFLLLSKIPWRKIIYAGFAIGIGFIPLFVSPAFHGNQLDWLQKPSLVQLPFGIVALGGDSLFATAIFCLLILSLALKYLKNFMNNKDRFNVGFLFLCAFLPLTTAFFFSVFVKPLYEAESFNSSLPAFILLATFALDKLMSSKKLFFATTYSLLLLFSVVRLAFWYSNNPRFSLIFENQNPRDWRAAEQLVEHEEKDGDALIFYSYYIRFPFSYYLNKSSVKHLPETHEISSGKYALGGGTSLPEPDKKILDTLSIDHERVWLVLSYNDVNWLSRRHQWQEVENELKHYYTEVEDKKLNEIEVKLFIKKTGYL